MTLALSNMVNSSSGIQPPIGECNNSPLVRAYRESIRNTCGFVPKCFQECCRLSAFAGSNSVAKATSYSLSHVLSPELVKYLWPNLVR